MDLNYTGARTRPVFLKPRTAPAHRLVDTHGRSKMGNMDTHSTTSRPIPSYP